MLVARAGMWTGVGTDHRGLSQPPHHEEIGDEHVGGYHGYTSMATRLMAGAAESPGLVGLRWRQETHQAVKGRLFRARGRTMMACRWALVEQ